MRACICHDVPTIVVRQIANSAATAEGKLQHAHTRKTKIITEEFHVRSYDAKVFSDHRQITKLLLNGFEEFSTRCRYPLASLSSFVPGGNLPTGCKPTEVIDSNEVKHLQRCAKTL